MTKGWLDQSAHLLLELSLFHCKLLAFVLFCRQLHHLPAGIIYSQQSCIANSC